MLSACGVFFHKVKCSDFIHQNPFCPINSASRAPFCLENATCICWICRICIIPGTSHILVNVSGLDGESNVSSHIAHTHRTEWISQPPLLRKDRLMLKHWCFIMLRECQWSPLVFDRRALSAQPTDLIKTLVNQWPTTATWSWMERLMVNTCIPLQKSASFRAQNGSSLEEVFVCSWENHVSVFTVCASIWAENILSHVSLNTD